MKQKDMLLAVLGILFISFNLRAPITAVGSIVELIQTEYALSNAAAGLLTTLPLMAFAGVSPFVARISSQVGHSRTMMAGLLLILLGELVRSYTGAAGLFVGTAVMGVGIAIGNVVIPAMIKLYFSETVGVITSIYTSGMCVFAAVGAGISVPLANGIGIGWKHALAAWVVLTLLTIGIWMPQVAKKQGRASRGSSRAGRTSIWKSPLAWWVTLYMGTQSLLFYSLVAWLPTIILSKGMADRFAGRMALIFQLMAIPATLLIPSLCDRWKDQRALSAGICAVYGLGILCLLAGQGQSVILLAVICMAVGMGGSISLSIAFLSLRSPTPARASELSGMSQSAGYLLAALGPVLTGLMFDLRSSWTMPLLLLAVLTVVLAFCGMFAGRNETVTE